MPSDGPGVHKRELGKALARLRGESGSSREEAAEAVGCTGSTIGRYERGEVVPRPGDLRSLLDHYSADQRKRSDLESLARDGRKRRPKTEFGTVVPDWFRKFLHLEEAAAEIRVYETELVYGLLQTADYARALHQANPLNQGDEPEKLVQARLARQERVLGENPPKLDIVVNEAALRRVVGGRDVMRAQLRHLASCADSSEITLRVMPFSAGAHASTGLNFVLLRFADGNDVAYLESQTLAQRRGDPDEAAKYELLYQRMADLALDPDVSADFIATLSSEL